MAFINLPSNGSQAFKDPVASVAALPAANNVTGDIRVTLDTGTIYFWDGASWQAAKADAVGGAGLSSLNGQVGTSQTFAVGSSGTNFNIASAANIHTFNIPDASNLNRGAVTTGSQTFVGNKTFDDNLTVTDTFKINDIEHDRVSGLLLDNNSGTILSFSTSYKYAILEYSMQRDGAFRTGRMLIANDATNANSSDDYVEMGTSGVLLSAVVSGANLNINYVSSSTGFNTAFKCLLKKW